jgi:hypothetical protein
LPWERYGQEIENAEGEKFEGDKRSGYVGSTKVAGRSGC